MLTGLFQPLGQRTFDDTFAHLGHYDVSHEIVSIVVPQAFPPVLSWLSNSNSKCLANWRPSAPTTSSRPACAPSSSMEVTGLVSPHGTMYWKYFKSVL